MKQLVYPAELEMAARDEFRGLPLYSRLTDLVVTADEEQRGGWDIEIEGRFSQDDRLFIAEAVARLRNRFQLCDEPDPLFGGARRSRQGELQEPAADQPTYLLS